MCILATLTIRTGLPVDCLIVLSVPSIGTAVHCSDRMRDVVFDWLMHVYTTNLSLFALRIRKF
jgi:hypothetical protein